MYYKPQFPEWLDLAARDGRGGIAAEPITIVRGAPCSFIYNLNAHDTFGDWTGGAFSSDLRASPDAASVLASWTISVGTPASGVTPVTFTLPVASQSGIPTDADGDGVTELMMQVDYTPSGGAANAIIQTRVLVVGSV